MAALVFLAACGSGVCAGCSDDAPGDPPDAFTARTNDVGACISAFPMMDSNGTPHMFEAPDDKPCERVDRDDGWTFTCPQPDLVGGSVTFNLNADLTGEIVVAYARQITECNRTAAIVAVTIE